MPDERVAGYFALGIAQQLRQPVAVICTSGTALLNLGPAVCEAFYQKVPLLLLTADRPEELIGIGENQAIEQDEIYRNYIKKSYSIGADESEKGGDEIVQLLSAAIDDTTTEGCGPVHVNIHLREPLYTFTEENISASAIDEKEERSTKAIEKIPLEKKTLVVVGLMQPNEELNKQLQQLAAFKNVVVITESTSNSSGESFVYSADSLLAALKEDEAAAFSPHLVIQIGLQVVSKRLKEFLKRNPPQLHLQITEGTEEWNSFRAVRFRKITDAPSNFISAVLNCNTSQESDYSERWKQKYAATEQEKSAYLQQVPFCDFKVFETLVNSFPEGAHIQYGNSSPIRYSNFFTHKKGIQVNSNRGTSGIDGCVSTAAGAAYVSENLTVNIVGDVSFFYDSNALWNNNLSPNLRVIIINNSGGNIFRLIDGPDKVNDFEKFFETRHNLRAEHIASMYGIPYYFCDAQKGLDDILKTFYGPQNGKPAILEIKTDGELSAQVFKDYWKIFKPS